MKQIAITLGLIFLVFNCLPCQAQEITKEQKKEFIGALFGWIGRSIDKGIVKKNTKKSKKQIVQWEKEEDWCAVQCHTLNEETGKIDYNFECEIKCNQERRAEEARMKHGEEEIAKNDVADETRRQAEIQRKQAEEEAARQAELARKEAERKAAEERKNALEQVEIAKINGYAFDETALSDSQKSELDKIAEILNKYSDVKALIIGHTCKIGYKNINDQKGLKRADAGKEYLVSKGIAQERISTNSKGETEPLVPNISGENRKQNRRIEFVIK